MSIITDVVVQVPRDVLRPGLYFFKARWCHYCKLATPIINEISQDQRYSRYVNEISVGSEDEEVIITPKQRALTGVSFQELHQMFKVRGYPTIVMVSRDGRMTTYQGQRNVVDIERAIVQQDFYIN